MRKKVCDILSHGDVRIYSFGKIPIMSCCFFSFFPFRVILVRKLFRGESVLQMIPADVCRECGHAWSGLTRCHHDFFDSKLYYKRIRSKFPMSLIYSHDNVSSSTDI